jgi:hypothetical protein
LSPTGRACARRWKLCAGKSTTRRSGRDDRGWARQQPRSAAAAIDFLCQASFARSTDAPFAPYVLAALQCALANREHSDPQVQLCAFETLTAAWGWIVRGTTTVALVALTVALPGSAGGAGARSSSSNSSSNDSSSSSCSSSSSSSSSSSRPFAQLLVESVRYDLLRRACVCVSGCVRCVLHVRMCGWGRRRRRRRRRRQCGCGWCLGAVVRACVRSHAACAGGNHLRPLFLFA